MPNTIKTLQFTNAARPKSIPTVQLRRNKLSNQLWQQIELAKSQLNHTHFVVKRRVTVKDLEGNYKSVERPKRLKPWWFMAEDGTLCLSIFYGSKRIEIIPGKTSISTKNLEDLIATLALIKSEVETGGLDTAIENASSALKLNFNKSS